MSEDQITLFKSGGGGHEDLATARTLYTLISENVAETTYDDESAEVGVTYYYWVAARNDTGATGLSETDAGRRIAEPPVPQELALSQDFEDGMPSAADGWEYYASNDGGRTRVVEGVLQMDRAPSGAFSLNEAILHLNLEERSGVTLTLDHTSIHDEPHALVTQVFAFQNRTW